MATGAAGLPHLVLLHGSNGCAAEMEALAAPLRAFAQVHVPDLPGHGGRPIPARISVEDAAAEVIAALDAGGIERAVFAGYSSGGYIATWLARHHPGRTLGACAIATRFQFTPEAINHWIYLAQPERLARPGNPRAGEMLRAHGPDWADVSRANAGFFAELGRAPPLAPGDLAAIEPPVLLVNGNRDAFVPWSETLAAGKAIPRAKLVMFFGIAHPLRNVPAVQVARAVEQWLAEQASP